MMPTSRTGTRLYEIWRRMKRRSGGAEMSMRHELPARHGDILKEIYAI